MKIYSMEIQTDLGRRVIQLSPPISIDPTGVMPPHFRSLIEMLVYPCGDSLVSGVFLRQRKDR